MDFSLVLLIALLVTGGIWGWDRWLRPARPVTTAGDGDTGEAGEPEAAPASRARDSAIVEYARAFFPVILVVFVLRSFIVEPFRIPTGSMVPSLKAGDFILVNKFSYGLRLPVVDTKVVDLGSPERGDIMVFRFPHDESVNYIKRVIGVPGDRILYRDKQLFINGEPVEQDAVGPYSYRGGSGRVVMAHERLEHLDGSPHDILVDPSRPERALELTVPEGSYFVMGDNRDYSNDSRFWGFVPEANIVGEAFLIWFSWDKANGGGVNWSRIGDIIR